MTAVTRCPPVPSPILGSTFPFLNMIYFASAATPLRTKKGSNIMATKKVAVKKTPAKKVAAKKPAAKKCCCKKACAKKAPAKKPAKKAKK